MKGYWRNSLREGRILLFAGQPSAPRARMPGRQGRRRNMSTPIRGTVFGAVVAAIALVATACGGGGAATHFALRTKNSQPAGITTGPDARIWFTEFTSGRIAKINPAGQMDEFPLPTDRAGPFDITSGPDGNLWFTEFSADKIGRITTVGDIKEFPLPTPKSGPYGITAGPDGNLWFALQKTDKIARMTLQGDVTEFAIPYQGPTRPSPWGVAT